MERSDFWVCGEEKLSETGSRKIRAGGKLKNLLGFVSVLFELTKMPSLF